MNGDYIRSIDEIITKYTKVNGMCLAERYIEHIQRLEREASNAFRHLRSALSEVDTEVSLIYHEIEFGKFNVVQGYHLAKRLKEVLKRRRAIKNEIATAQMLTAHSKNLLRSLRKKLNEENSIEMDIGDLCNVEIT